MILPGLIPRAKNLFASGFGYLAFLMASIYGIVKLLPRNHPYLIPENIGRYGIRHVIGEAANNLTLSRKNIDQIIIFTALLLGIGILFMQLALLAYGYIVAPAMAQIAGPTGPLFSIPPDQARGDIAFMLLDRVFGIPDIYNSCVALGGECIAGSGRVEPGNLPQPFHVGLHSLFRFYSLGLLVVATLIFMYFVVIVIGETAVTGTPFGQRFQNVWVPIRLVVALGLLVPINYGLNSGQYITLYAAKLGSNFATNGWITFNSVLSGQTGIANRDTTHVAKPNTPDITATVSFMSMVHACTYAYWHMDKSADKVVYNDVQPFRDEPQTWIMGAFLVKNVSPQNNPQNDLANVGIMALDGQSTFFLDDIGITDNQLAYTYDVASQFFNNSDITIRFGRLSLEPEFNKYKGNVEPTCGEIKIHVSDKSGAVGPTQMQEYYFNLVRDLWTGDQTQTVISAAHRFMSVQLKDNEWNGTYVPCTICTPEMPCGANRECPIPTQEIKDQIVTTNYGALETAITAAWNAYNTILASEAYDPQITAHGWGGAGMWYNRINEVNGAFTDAVRRIPSVVTYPLIMEDIRHEKLATDANVSPLDQFEPHLADGNLITLNDNTYAEAIPASIGAALSAYFQFWSADGSSSISGDQDVTGNVFNDLFHFVFGTSGLMAIRGENQHIHPLAQLTAVGKSLVDSAIFNVLGATSGGIEFMFDILPGITGKAAAGFATQIAFVALTAGFVLYYILPFLPFVYFFFAVGAWVKSIFEAMVGVPLWALAHLRLDGEGLPGDSASNGYFLIFEIFLRPILTVFALIASILIFTAQVRILNFIWPLVLDNLTGADSQYDANVLDPFGETIRRGGIDQFFFTIIYTTIVYMLATASFKLIDNIPDNILRWMGAGVSSFSDINDDATEGLTRYAAVGGLTFGRQLVTSAQGLGQGARGILGNEIKKMDKVVDHLTKQ